MHSIYQSVTQLLSSGENGVLCTIIRCQGSTPRKVGSKMLVHKDGTIEGSIGGGEMESRVITQAMKTLSSGEPNVLQYRLNDPNDGDPGVCGGQVEIFIEPVLQHPELVVVGGGHVGAAVAKFASWLGFRVVVSDDRVEYCTKDVIPDAEIFYNCPLEELANQLEIKPTTTIVLATRSLEIDVAGLPSLINSNPAYIGVIGSKRRWATTQNQLLDQGISPDRLKKIYSPIGLKIGAETPEEIALSIMAEIVQQRNGYIAKSQNQYRIKSMKHPKL